MRRTVNVSKAVVGVIGMVVAALVLAGCRSGPPPAAQGPNLGLASKSQGVANYQGVIVMQQSCSSFGQANDQIVCIVNHGTSPVTIGGWLIRNEIGRTYYFPKGTVLAPKATIKVHTGAGTNNAGNLYWNYQFKPVFDTPDQIQLVDDSDVVVSQLTTQ
jgi:hypothetical protein